MQKVKRKVVPWRAIFGEHESIEHDRRLLIQREICDSPDVFYKEMHKRFRVGQKLNKKEQAILAEMKATQAKVVEVRKIATKALAKKAKKVEKIEK